MDLRSFDIHADVAADSRPEWIRAWLGMCRHMGGSHRYSVTTSKVATLGVAPSWAESKT